MEIIFSKRVQLSAVVMVIGVGILAVVDVLRGMTEIFTQSGPLGVAMTIPLAVAAGLFAWAARENFDGKDCDQKT